MAITKKKTNKCKHYTATQITGVYLDAKNKQRGMVSFIDHIGVEVHFRITKDEYLHVNSGAGCEARAFDNGLPRAHRYRFSICTEMIDYDGVPEETVVAIHAVPNDTYMDCDWSQELQEIVPDGGIKLTVRPNGGMDLISFPYQYRGSEAEILSRLEALDKINTATQFTLSNKKSSVRCRRTMDDSSAMLVVRDS